MFLARKFERRSSDVDCDATSPCVHSPRSPLFICVFGAQTQKQTHINVESKFHLTALRFDSIPFSIWFCFCFWTSALGLQFFSLRPFFFHPPALLLCSSPLSFQFKFSLRAALHCHCRNPLPQSFLQLLLLATFSG